MTAPALPPLISSDGHLEVRPERWSPRMPAKYRDRAPRTIKLPDGGDALLVEGQPPYPAPFLDLRAGRTNETWEPFGVTVDDTEGLPGLVGPAGPGIEERGRIRRLAFGDAGGATVRTRGRPRRSVPVFGRHPRRPALGADFEMAVAGDQGRKSRSCHDGLSFSPGMVYHPAVVRAAGRRGAVVRAAGLPGGWGPRPEASH